MSFLSAAANRGGELMKYFQFYDMRRTTVARNYLVRLAVIAVLLIPTAGFASGNFEVSYGQQTLTSTDWDPVESMMGYGVHLDFDLFIPYTNLAVGINQFASDKETVTGLGTIEVTISEIEIGARSYLDNFMKRRKRRRLRREMFSFIPFAGIGLSYYMLDADFTATIPANSESDSGTGYGLYVEGGCQARIYNEFYVGLRAKYGSGTGEIGSAKFAMSNFLIGLTAGYHW